MKRVIFDTNVYTALLKEGEAGKSVVVQAAALGFRFYGFEELRKDFVIVATASIHGIDVIVSEDAKTMFSKETVRAYQIINVKTQLRTPFFHSLAAFRAFLQSQSAKGEDND